MVFLFVTGICRELINSVWKRQHFRSGLPYHIAYNKTQQVNIYKLTIHLFYFKLYLVSLRRLPSRPRLSQRFASELILHVINFLLHCLPKREKFFCSLSVVNGQVPLYESLNAYLKEIGKFSLTQKIIFLLRHFYIN